MSALLIHVPAMCCPVEGGKIEQKLQSMEGILSVRCEFSSRTVIVEHTRSEIQPILEAILSLGMQATPIQTASRRLLFSIPEMDCPVEAGQIERQLAKDGIQGARLNIENRTLTIEGDDTVEQRIVEAVKACGYTAKPINRREDIVEQQPIPWKLYLGALFIALLSEAIELWGEYTPETFPLSHDHGEWLTLGLAVLAIAMSGLTTFKNGLIALKNLTLNMNALMAVAVTGGVLIGAWPEAAMVMVLFQISESIEQLSMAKARRSIRDLMNVTPEKALVSQKDGTFASVAVEEVGPGALVRVSPGDRIPLDGRIVKGNTSIDQSSVTGESMPVEKAPVEEVGPGALVRVSPGDRIPLDGRIVKGNTSIDQSSVTGESMPVEKAPGDTVWSGTVNRTHTIEMLVTASASDSLSSRIIDAVENARASKSPVQRFVDRFASVYTPIVFVIAASVAVIPPLFDGLWADWLYKALCLLVIACPCALVISTPVTIVSALATATRCGLLIKGGLYLEEARKLVNIGLDKTGTLTRGEPAVTDVTYIMTFDEKLTGSMAASLAAMNKHPLSQAIVRWAQHHHLPTYNVEGFEAIAGAGVQGRVENGLLRLVNLRWLENAGLADETVRHAFRHYTDQGMSAVALADTFGVQAVFGFSDQLKDDAREGLQQLADVGLTPWLLTGDNQTAARTLADKLGITHIKAELLPEDKLNQISDLQKSGLTAMVGDGINDAPALAKADIGIAMGVRGTDSAIEAAHIAVMDDRISSIATLVRLSRITHSVLIQNIVFAIGVKLIFTVLALSGLATMWMAVFADTGTCLIVVANGMRLLHAKKKLDRLAQAAQR